MSDDQFTKLFRYMQEMRNDFENLRNEMKTDINRIYNLLDADVKHKENEEQERLAADHKLNRHQRWITQLAENTDTQLVPKPE